MPSLHSAKLNPHIDFEKTSFVVNQELRDWNTPVVDGQAKLRIAGISSFGAGGSNAHMIIEEYLQPNLSADATDQGVDFVIVPLSAKTSQQLSQKVVDLLRFLKAHKDTDTSQFASGLSLGDLAYTLQIGREAMEERLGLLVTSLAALEDKLLRYSRSEQNIEGCFFGTVKRGNDSMGIISQDDDMKKAVDTWIARKKYAKLTELWVKGLELVWNKLYLNTATPGLISLPTYPFSREKYWFDGATDIAVSTNHSQIKMQNNICLHPLIQINVSDLNRQCYRSDFSGNEFFLADHKVVFGDTASAFDGRDEKPKANSQAHKVLPAVAYIEMVRAAVTLAVPEQQRSKTIVLRNLVWALPLIASDQKSINVELHPEAQQQLRYEVYSHASSIKGEQQYSENEILHCQGKVSFDDVPEPNKIDVERLKHRFISGNGGESGKATELSPSQIYDTFDAMGLQYGSAFRAINSMLLSDKELLAHLCLPTTLAHGADKYYLHPTLMDGALQASIGLMLDLSAVPQRPALPFSIDKAVIYSASDKNMFAWLRFSGSGTPLKGATKLDIDLFDSAGNICVQFTGLCMRSIENSGAKQADKNKNKVASAATSLLVVPFWQNSALKISVNEKIPEAMQTSSSRHIVIVPNSDEFDLAQLRKLRPDSEFISPEITLHDDRLEDYTDIALFCFEQLQIVMSDASNKHIFVQLIARNRGEQQITSGLSGLFKTAFIENPKVSGQVILTEPDTSTEQLLELLIENARNPQDVVIRYQDNVRQVHTWREITRETATTSGVGQPFNEQGTYIITGGLGGLGVIFAREILQQTQCARVILTGRSQMDEARWQNKKQEIIESSAGGAIISSPERLEYQALDILDSAQVQKLIDNIQKQPQKLKGIIHSAGMVADNYILKKTSDEFVSVLAPKINGTVNLDRATQDINLDFMVLFSSVAGAMGNFGQVDYACANGFMDQFADYRNQLVAQSVRKGKTVSINWPLWQSGGMVIDDSSLEFLKRTTGLYPMPTDLGITSFYQSLALPHSQILPVFGEVEKLRNRILQMPLSESQAPEKAITTQTIAGSTTDAQSQSIDVGTKKMDMLHKEMQQYLRKNLSKLLKLPESKIDVEAPLEVYGIDSVLTLKLTNELEKTFGSLSKTLFFEYQTLQNLAGYFAREYGEVVAKKIVADPRLAAVQTTDARVDSSKAVAIKINSSNRFMGAPAVAASKPDVAIIGMSGKYPQAENIEEFWDNLKAGKDCITEIPETRWNHKKYFDPRRNQPGKSYSKWGGFISDIDKFEPLFFNISPKEAELMDPQERLFLEQVWYTLEDAGYSKESLSGNPVGVYVGVMWGQYELFGAEATLAGNSSVPGASHASIANRISYFFNFHGPSLALDTMCSSSLTAIHMAAEEIRKGEIDMAIAGGVNLSVHPHKYLALSQGNFVSSDGYCRSFGEGGDGYVPGEGVGAILLKNLDKALAQGDNIYAVVKSSSINHGGKTNGYTVPNPIAQADLIRDALSKANIAPNSIRYIEAHGTGTSLGDPIEIAGLSRAFGVSNGPGEKSAKGSTENISWPIGSVKSNIGHLESAAGIAAVTKAILQIKHQQLVPSIHADVLNPNINFDESKVYVQKQLSDWTDSHEYPRRVAVSSFGAGGSNAHMVLEEHIPSSSAQLLNAVDETQLFVVSARSSKALSLYVQSYILFLQAEPDVSLKELVYTAQVGRSAMNEKLAIVASTLEELKASLQEWLSMLDDKRQLKFYAASKLSENIFYSNLKQAEVDARALIEGEAGEAFLKITMETRDLKKMARLWVSGVTIDWSLLYRDTKVQRTSLPKYPFIRESYWFKSPFSESSIDGWYERRSLVEENLDISEIEGKKRVYFNPQWQVSSAQTDENVNHNTDTFLIFDHKGELYNAMLNLRGVDSRENKLIRVVCGDVFGQHSERLYSVNPASKEDFFRLVASLNQSKQLPQHVIYCGENSIVWPPEVDSGQEPYQNFYLVLYLCQALIRQDSKLHVNLLSIFCDSSETGSLIEHALAGLLKTLSAENPRFSTKSINLQTILGQSKDADSTIHAELARIVSTELGIPCASSIEVLYKRESTKQDYTRYVKVLNPCLLEQSEVTKIPLKQNGVYIISGGLGGLGYIISEYLARTHEAKLVLLGRSALDEKLQVRLNGISPRSSDVIYIQANTTSIADMNAVVEKATQQFGTLNGVIHCAGVNNDALLINKDRASVDVVLDPKVLGALNLDWATRSENLDLFVMFSSVSSIFGNPGQSDYAYGNQFLDAFANHRNLLRAKNQRWGRAVSINWPYWQDGGMTLSQRDIDFNELFTGMAPLPADSGIRCFEEILCSELEQVVPLYGAPSKISSFVQRSLQAALGNLKTDNSAASVGESYDELVLLKSTEEYLQKLIGAEIKLAPEQVGSRERFESFGIDSVIVSQINLELEKEFGALPKTLIYEYETIEELSGYLVKHRAPTLIKLFKLEDSIPKKDSKENDNPSTVLELVKVPENAAATHRGADKDAQACEEIAIIGMHGQFPHSENLEEYWRNLEAGKELIELVPSDRWDYKQFEHSGETNNDTPSIYCKWGGFLANFDKFDAELFNISEQEARVIDPQERLFLQSVWATIEDAGYTRERLRQRYQKSKSADVGVFVGVTSNTYHLLTSEEWAKGNMNSPGALPWSIANRVSYFFDFQGPSMPVDTACSSSLVAIHLACESLQKVSVSWRLPAE